MKSFRMVFKIPGHWLAALALLAASGFAMAQARTEIRRAQEPAAEAVPEQAADENYKLKPGDLIDVKVYQIPDLSGQVRIREDGSVSLPLINEKVGVAGLSLAAVEQKVRAILAKDYVKNPSVSTNIVEYGKIKFTVYGQVTQGGGYTVPNNKPVTLPEAIGRAGGPTRLANMKKVYLKRMVAGREVVQIVDAQEMSRTANGSIYIRDGDVITVIEKNF